MNIQEALRSGKPFKRKNDSEKEWLIVDGNNIIRFETAYRSAIAEIGASDILATDWETKSDG